MLSPGTRVGPFEVVSQLGAGGMGEVYRARDPRLERQVALKVLPPEALTSATARARLLREARLAARLSHPNICTVHEVGEDAGQVFIAMELVAGRSLADRLEAGALAAQEVLHYGAQIAGALAHAHARGVVHRDLKSSNVVVTPEGQAKDEARRTLELYPDEPSGLFVLGAALQKEGRHAEAIAVHERMGELYPFFRWLTGTTYARAGRGEDARRIAAEIEAEKMTAMDIFGLAVLYGALGDVESTYRWLTREPNHCWRCGVALDPIVGIPREVLATPRFDEFMARLNLPWWKG